MYVGIYICIINLAHAQCMHLLSTCFSTTELVFIESRRIIKNECFDLMRIFSRGGGGGGINLIKCKKKVFWFTGRREKKIVSYFALQMMTVMKRFSG